MKEFFLFGVFLLFSANSYAETITMKNGKIVEGTIVERSRKSIKVDVGAGVDITYYFDDIENIEDTAPVKQVKEEIKDDKKDEPVPLVVVQESQHVVADVNEVLLKVRKQYSSLASYVADGKIVFKAKAAGFPQEKTTFFSIKMARPNFFNISWLQNSPLGPSDNGAIWNTGDAPYLYLGSRNVSTKLASNQAAFGTAAGVSQGVTTLLPNMFFYGYDLVDLLENPKLIEDDSVNGEVCYVVEGESSLSNNHKFWISKERLLILKVAYTLDKVPDNFNDVLGNESASDGMNAMGMDINNENRQNFQKMMKFMNAQMKNMNLTATTEQYYNSIETNVNLDRREFIFKVPGDSQYSDDIFKNPQPAEDFNQELKKLESLMEVMEEYDLNSGDSKGIQDQLKQLQQMQ